MGASPKYPVVIYNPYNLFTNRSDISDNLVSVIIAVDTVDNVVDNIYVSVNANSSIADSSVYTTSQTAIIYAINNVIDNINVVTGAVYIINSAYNTYKSVIVGVNSVAVITTPNTTCDYVVVNSNKSINVSRAASYAVGYPVESVHNIVIVSNTNTLINVFNYEHLYKGTDNSVINNNSVPLT